MKILLFLLLCHFLGSPQHGIAQGTLSKKERKAQEQQASGSRYFIEGTKALALGDLEKAFFYLEKAEGFSPKEPAISYKLAEVLLRSKEAEKALPFAKQAATLDPENMYYALMMAEIYSDLNLPLKAAEILDSLTSGSSKNQQYNLDLASIYLNANAFDKALVVLDRAEGYYGVREAFTQQKQRIYLKKDQLGKAIEEGEKLIAAFPGNPRFVLGLVEILYNNAQLEEAIRLVRTEISKYPNQPELQMAAYTLYKEKGQLAAATAFLFEAVASPDLGSEAKTSTFQGILQELKTREREILLDSLESLMVSIHPEDAKVIEILGHRRKADMKATEALLFYKKSLSLQPKNEALFEEVIVTSFESGTDYAEVSRYTELAVEEFPKSAEFWFYEGVVKAAVKKDSLAVLALNTALRLNADKNQQLAQVAYSTLGNSLYELGNTAASFANFEKALALQPDDEQVLNNYAYFLSLEKRDLEKAQKMAERVVKKHPNTATYLDTLAWILFQRGDYAAAAAQQEKAIRLEKVPSGTMLEHYGDMVYHLGKVEEALNWWKKAQESGEGSKSLTQKIKEGKYHD